MALAPEGRPEGVADLSDPLFTQAACAPGRRSGPHRVPPAASTRRVCSKLLCNVMQD